MIDIDFFTTSENSLSEFISRNSLSKSKKCSSTLCDTYTDRHSRLLHHLKCRPGVRDVFQLMDTFDFTICQFAMSKDAFWLTIDAEIHARAKELHHATLTPKWLLSTIKRINKYGRQGFKAPSDAVEVLAEAIRDLSDNEWINQENFSGGIDTLGAKDPETVLIKPEDVEQ